MVFFSGARRYDLSGNITLLADTHPEYFIGFVAGEGLTLTLYIIYVSFEKCYEIML
jgi:hypothetical protein